MMGELYIASWSPVDFLVLFPVFEAAAKCARSTDESTTEQEQAGWFGDVVGGWGKSANTPLVNILKRRAVQALNRHTVDDRAFRGLDTEEVLAVGVDGEDLVEHLAAHERVIDREL